MTNQILIWNNDPSTFPNETSCVESVSVVDTLDVTATWTFPLTAHAPRKRSIGDLFSSRNISSSFFHCFSFPVWLCIGNHSYQLVGHFFCPQTSRISDPTTAFVLKKLLHGASKLRPSVIGRLSLRICYTRIGVNMDWEKWGIVRETTFRELTPSSRVRTNASKIPHILTRYHTL